MVQTTKPSDAPARGSFHDLARQVDRYFVGRCPTIRTRPIAVPVRPPVDEDDL